MAAENFYIALVDTERGRMNYPYYVDDVDDDPPDPAVWYPFGEGQARGITAYALRRNEPLLIEYPFFQELIARGEVSCWASRTPNSTWVGVPLVADGRQLGIVVVQSYTAAVHYTKSDLDLLVFVAQHVANALVRARAIEETRERNAELAIINEISSALAKQLDYESMYDLVGRQGALDLRRTGRRRSRSSTPARRSSLIVFVVERGVRLPNITTPYFGVGKHLVETRELAPHRPHDMATVVAGLGQTGVIQARRAVLGRVRPAGRGGPRSAASSPSRTSTAICILRGRRPADHHDHANMGVALENARLFDETKRLLGETDARAAELAIINEIGQALAKQLNFKAVIDLVGERIRASSTPARCSSRPTTRAPAGSTSRISRSGGTADDGVPHVRPGPDVARHPDTGAAAVGKRSGGGGPRGDRPDADPSGGHAAPWSAIVDRGPDLQRRAVMGVLAMESTETDAYDEADERLLTTVASSMGVALENARLFDQTKRLLAETDARAKELAVVNEVQRGLAEHIDMQAMYDLAGDKLCDIFGANSADIFGAQASRSPSLDPVP